VKVLFINQFFWPDSSATSQQLTDLATGLAARPDMQVSVLCGEGGYAAAASSAAPAGVRILRVKALPFAKGKLGRILSYASFYATATVRALFTSRQDVVVSLTTPPLISLLGTMLKMLRGSHHFIWEQDIYPDVARDLGAFRPGSPIDRSVGVLADFSRRHADGIIALGDCMKARLVARGIPAGRIAIAENWANSTLIEPMPRPGDPRELVLLYSGNLGLAHDLDTFTGALVRLRDDARFRFLFVGSGEKRKQLAAFCEARSITSVELRPYVDRDKLSEGLAAGDIGLVTQHSICCGSVVPSKVYGILAAGRPLLFIGPAAATPALVIARHNCGWHIEPGDVDGLTHLLLHLAGHRDEVYQAGVRARQALLDHYDLPASIERFADILQAHAPAGLSQAAINRYPPGGAASSLAPNPPHTS
jgi:colanic acid biosynthesis glycosyl transferase WcaI